MRIGKFRKSPGDRKRYEVNYDDWLNSGETLVAVTLTGNNIADGFFVDGHVIDSEGKEVIFYVSGGVACQVYEVRITVRTSLDQIKEDTIEFSVAN